ncbi:hypothetical protein K458DRAFT_465835 [Lentithecium fluviatile CBS 122367]|uniref:HTH CENPB-type domain-containing protein n=1 Tax=Lentithecium fluviatile CBS 122367 TaxID=1168545 RepID=A0A6G1IID7_9PLEO|nr:hypothetical protein K458DRAFT_465835 [Lentithecium fluviatile CBS 122367]
MAAIDAALAAIDSLKRGEKVNYTHIAAEYGVARSTLSKRHRGVQRSNAERIIKCRNLNISQESALVEYIKALHKRGLPPTRQMVRNFALEIAKKEVGKCWVDRFMGRHKDRLISRWTSGIDAVRQRAD